MRPLSTFANLSRPFHRLFFQQISLNSSSSELQQILNAEPHLLIVLNHGHMFAPVISLPALHDILVRYGGGNRRVLTVTLKIYYQLPILKYFTHYLTQSLSNLNAKELIGKINSNSVDDILIMPEGEHCGFGNGIALEPFISPRFAEIAIRTNTPILLAVHRGTHYWTRHYPALGKYIARLPQGTPWLSERRRALLNKDGMNLSRLRAGRLKRYPWFIQLHRPTITAAEFEAANPEQQAKIIQQEATVVHQKMTAALINLPHPA